MNVTTRKTRFWNTVAITAFTRSTTLLLLALFVVSSQAADAPSTVASQPDKTSFNLLNPTPPALMREMVTDRPDKTEAPYTVDAGHFQIEMDLLTHTWDHDTSDGADTRTRTLTAAPINLKAGLFNNIDLQLILETWNQVEQKDNLTGITTRHSGFGDITTRLKINLWGNDGGKTAFGVMPFLKIPTSQAELGNSSVEGGIILPLAIELPRGFSLGLMTELDLLRNQANHGFHPEFINSITLGHGLIGKLEAYVEFFGQVSTEAHSRWIGTFDFGFAYGFTPNLRLDAGLNVGLTDSADDWNPFLGLSYRF
jgi:hypothetical protein